MHKQLVLTVWHNQANSACIYIRLMLLKLSSSCENISIAKVTERRRVLTELTCLAFDKSFPAP
jgi:hypothetical protein